MFLAEARGVLQRADEAVKAVKAVASGERGEIHVGFAPSLTVEILPKTLRHFQESSPGVRVQLHDFSTQEMLRGLRDGKLDVALMIQASAMLAHGVFDRFAKLRVAFLEGGATWVPFMMDRLDRSYHAGHVQLVVNGKLLGGPAPGENASEYFQKQLREGRIFVGFDCDDDGLGTAVNKGGRQSFLFGSDFPNLPYPYEAERTGLWARDLPMDVYRRVFNDNARAFFRIGP